MKIVFGFSFAHGHVPPCVIITKLGFSNEVHLFTGILLCFVEEGTIERPMPSLKEVD